MAEAILNFSEQLFVEILATLLAALLLFVGYVLFLRGERKKLLEFFAISTEHSDVQIYLSRLQVKPGGTESLEPLTHGFIGPAITKIEYDGAITLSEVLKFNLVAKLPRGMHGWLARQDIAFKVLEPAIKVSPLPPISVQQLFTGTLIVLGTSIYNSVSQYYMHYLEQNSDCYFYYQKNADGIREMGLRKKGFADRPPTEGRIKGNEVAFVQRINDSNGAVAFLCAGLGSSATYGAARYLAQNWDVLSNSYGNNEFGVLLLFSEQAPDALSGDHVVTPEVIEAYPHFPTNVRRPA